MSAMSDLAILFDTESPVFCYECRNREMQEDLREDGPLLYATKQCKHCGWEWKRRLS